jgi:hypothetical protein
MVEYLKNNKVTIIVVTLIVVIAYILVYQSSQKVEELTETKISMEKTIISMKEVHKTDSTYAMTLVKQNDSLAKLVHKTTTNEFNDSSVKNGKSKTTTTTTTTGKDGSSTTTTTVTEVDTSYIVSKRVKTVVDSMASIIEQVKKEVKIEYREVHDTTYRDVEKVVEKHDTTIIDKKISPAPKKFLLAASTGVSSSGDLKVLPDIQLDGRYSFWGPLFVRGGVSYMGNPITSMSDPGNYRVGAGVGIKFEF